MSEAEQAPAASQPQQTNKDGVVLVCPCCGKEVVFSQEDVKKAMLQARRQQAREQPRATKTTELQSSKLEKETKQVGRSCAKEQPAAIRATCASEKPWSESLRMAALALSASTSRVPSRGSTSKTNAAVRSKQPQQQCLISATLPAPDERDALARWLKKASDDEKLDLSQFEAALMGAGWSFERLRSGAMVTKEELRELGVHQPHRRALFHEIKVLRNNHRLIMRQSLQPVKRQEPAKPAELAKPAEPVEAEETAKEEQLTS